jgi:hypothetical protein
MYKEEGTGKQRSIHDEYIHDLFFACRIYSDNKMKNVDYGGRLVKQER